MGFTGSRKCTNFVCCYYRMGFTGSQKCTNFVLLLCQDEIHWEPDEAIKMLTLFAAMAGWDSP